MTLRRDAISTCRRVSALLAVAATTIAGLPNALADDSAGGGPFLRAGFGLGRVSPTIHGDRWSDGGGDRTLEGSSLAYQMQIGTRLSRFELGLVGVGLVMRDATQGERVNPTPRELKVHLATLGAFVSVYPSSTGRLYVQALAGVATLSIDTYATATTSSAFTQLGSLRMVGVGGAAGVGYWLQRGDRWDVGLAGLLHYASVENTSGDVRSTVVAPALLLTVGVR